ncbi:MAG: lytic transglycosylase domain-containing protein [Betaproteobacteria bacterium]|nr:lytic transglycosylase domain-containing protein [Betaproteobacteria bacterium]
MNTTALWQRLRTSVRGFWAALHRGFAILGVGALVFLVSEWNLVTGDVAAGPSTGFGIVRHDGESVLAAAAGEDNDNPKQRALANYLSRKYRVASDATEHLVGAAFDAGQRVGIDPLLILAVMAIESRFNPIAESVAGAKGLMQVIPKHHLDKFFEHGGEDAVLDPMTNIQVGARILKEYLRRTGNLEAALQLYAGALSDTSSQYAQKVIAEKERLRQAVQRFERQPARGSSA